MARLISARAISGFVRAVRYSAGTPARSNRARLLVQLSGRNSRNASMTGTSPRASVSDTRVWQLAVLPSAEAVSWNSEAGRVSGKIVKVHTKDVNYKGYVHHASKENPQYEIRADKTDHVALHKASALRRIRG